MDLCEELGMALDPDRRAQIDSLSTEALDALREEINRSKRWA